MIAETHPYWHLRSVLERREGVAAVPFSYYSYRPQTVEDRRTCFVMPLERFLNADFVHRVMQEAGAGQELAVHSDVRMCDGRSLHLVMVDMSTSARAHLEKLRSFLGNNFFQRIARFASGRSFHGYGETLLDHNEWVKFMGLLLLANQPHLEPTVDPRWIGHRLMAGYASLRWTCSTSHYLSLPCSIDIGAKTSNGRVAAGPIGRRLSRAGKSTT